MEQSQLEDLAYLKDQFYRLWDRSYIEDRLGRGRNVGGSPFEFLGRGEHFSAYKVTMDKGVLCIKTTNPEDMPPSSKAARLLVQSLTELQTISQPLWGPYEFFRYRDSIVMGQLFVTEPLSAAKPSWQPISKWEDILRDQLALRGYEILDKLQGGCVDQIPMIYDLSDLTLT